MTLRSASLCAALLAACSASEDPAAQPPVVEAVAPACADNTAPTPVTVRGSLPVKPVISIAGTNQLDTSYRAWVGDVELTAVQWIDPGQLTAVVPPGIPAGTYGLTLQSPFGDWGSRDAAIEVRQGPCPAQTARLAVVDPVAAPATVTVGQEVTVTATVQNVGQAAARSVLATVASAPPGLTFRSGPAGPEDVPAGQARTFTWAYSASASGGGVFVLEAAGTAADTGLPVAAPQVSTNSVLVDTGAFLTASTLVAPSRASVGQLITVALTVTNHTASNVVATPAITVVGPVTAGLVPAARDIAAGTTQAFQWTFTASGSGSASFTASVSGADPRTGAQVTVPTATATVVVQGAPGLGATLEIPARLELGDFTVTMRVSNDGGATAATVADVVPDLPTAGAGSTASVVRRSGPTNSPATVVAGEPAVAFTWVFTATSPGMLTLISVARGRDPNTGAAVASGAAESATVPVGLHTLGGTVSGLAGTGLVLRNGSETLPIGANGAFSFPAPLGSGANYTVTVAAQPSGPSQACTVANRSGTVGAVDVVDVRVTCATSAFTVGGSVSGLTGSGLVLRNGSTSLAIPARATSYAFPAPIPSGGTYAVAVTAQPSGPVQTCTVANGTGTVGAADVANVHVTCSTTTFTIGGTVGGLAGAGLVLRNGAESLPVAGNGPYAFAAPVASGGAYAVTVTAQPSGPSQVCTVANASGTVGAASVGNVNVTCATSAFTVGGSVSGLAGTGLVLRNGAESLPVTGNGRYAFATPVASGGTYAVTVTTQPTGRSQVCTVANASGTVGAASVVNVNVTCVTSSFTVGGAVRGLTGGGLVLRNGGGNNLTAIPAGATGYVLAAPVASGDAYAVTVRTQPSDPSQLCVVLAPFGIVGAANVVGVDVACGP